MEEVAKNRQAEALNAHAITGRNMGDLQCAKFIHHWPPSMISVQVKILNQQSLTPDETGRLEAQTLMLKECEEVAVQGSDSAENATSLVWQRRQ